MHHGNYIKIVQDRPKDIVMLPLNIKDEKDIAALRESAVLECKLAAGKDGKGQLPKDFWETYSAFANTRGGAVLLGVKEIKQGQFELTDVSNAEQVVTDLFNTLGGIEDACPLLVLDYQELPEYPDTDVRWLDRVVYDGTWSGNVFGFYLKVAPKLVADLKTPLKLVDGIRQDDTPQHKALREALINTLVHADYSDRASIRIQKSPNNYNFRNPGALRIPAEQVMKGGESDCRNRTLHQLFLMLGLGERAGSGLPKIRAAWEQLGYQVGLHDSFEPYDQTVLTLTLIQQDERVSEGVNGGANELYEFIKQNQPIRTNAMAQYFPQVTQRTIERWLKALKETGRIEYVGSSKTGGYRCING